MATSSITKNFIISGQKQVEMFADAIEASANDRTPRVPINVTYLQGTDNILKFMDTAFAISGWRYGGICGSR